MALYSYQIGTNPNATTNVESLTVPLPAPRGVFHDDSQRIPLASAGERGGGWMWAEWWWGFVTQAQYTQLKTFCAGASAAVYIRTRRNDGTFKYYSATMIWPEQTERDSGGVRIDFRLKFVNLSEYTPS